MSNDDEELGLAQREHIEEFAEDLLNYEQYISSLTIWCPSFNMHFCFFCNKSAPTKHAIEHEGDCRLFPEKAEPEEDDDVLHKSAAAIFSFIVEYKLTHDGNSPSYRELCHGTGLSSVSTIGHHMESLVNAGLIKHDKGSHNIIVVGGIWGMW